MVGHMGPLVMFFYVILQCSFFLFLVYWNDISMIDACHTPTVKLA
jgi:hypothetical protein